MALHPDPRRHRPRPSRPQKCWRKAVHFAHGEPGGGGGRSGMGISSGWRRGRDVRRTGMGRRLLPQTDGANQWHSKPTTE